MGIIVQGENWANGLLKVFLVLIMMAEMFDASTYEGQAFSLNVSSRKFGVCAHLLQYIDIL